MFAFVCTVAGHAESVSRAEALRKAKSFMQDKGMDMSRQMTEATRAPRRKSGHADASCYYVFNADKGFVNQESFKANGRQQLRELIRQNYNHPSIMFWGLFNELKEAGDNPVEYVKELNVMAHAEDPTRPTTAASNQGGALNFITDNIAWNRYDGWYGSTPATLATWLDATHRDYPELRIGISEYGAGASVRHQQDSVVQPVPSGRWHPENWQLVYHMENWRIISSRPFVWGSFVWNMFDFGAAHRTEGDRDGINDKGLVTHDRKTKKDAYYFYRSNWNPEPMVYIAGKRAAAGKRLMSPCSATAAL